MRYLKFFCLLLISIIFSFPITAQEETVFQIRNYRNDLSVQFNHKQIEFASLDAYGKIENKTLPNSGKYLFQGQEYDEFLAAYFFPSRMYDTKALRFFQVDPKSQYHSPYLFVGADPVNVIDKDGRQGKPLVLYGENHNFPDGISPDLKTLQKALPDAHYVPLSDVLNGDVVPLPEWNGDVYIDAHTGTDTDAQIEIERGNNSYDFKTEDMVSAVAEDGSETAGVSGEYMGERLRDLAEEKGVDVKNVFVGGCEGSDAAERISNGFVANNNGKIKNMKAKFSGTKKGRLLLLESGEGEFDDGIQSRYSGSRLHFVPKDKNISPKITTDENGEKFFEGFEHTDPASGVVRDVPNIDQQGISELTHGRVPQNITSELDVFERIY